ncbi:MAG: pyridoxal-dependent decarboxylase [Blastocatellia bacterium]
MNADTDPTHNTPEETLDPIDWSELRALGHKMLDDMLDYLGSLRDQSAWQPMPDRVRASFSTALPLEPQPADSVYKEFVENILPFTNGNRHPRFWGWVQGTGTPLGMLSDMLASGLNPHMAGFNQAPALVEHQVLGWLTEMMGMPKNSTGVLGSGGTMANIVGLVVARYAKAGFDVREEGLQSAGRSRLVLYGSSETHGWAQKAVELLGLGNESLRRIPVDADYRIDVAKLREAIESDRRAGHRPFCVIANAGTVNTGAIDDLEALAAICRDEDLWFHVDGAFGALARLSPELAPLVAGVERADSVAFDLHKWMYLPFEIACTIVRDAAAHRDAFAQEPSYLAETSRGVIAGGLPFADRGLELTRGFKALKVWMSLKTHGTRAFARLIEQNVNQARYLTQMIGEDPDLELLAPVPLNIVCFRYAPEGLSEASRDAVNKEVLLRVQESGLAVPSGTVLGGRYAIRVAITNHRSRSEDFEALVEAVLRLGVEVAREIGA